MWDFSLTPEESFGSKSDGSPIDVMYMSRLAEAPSERCHEVWCVSTKQRVERDEPLVPCFPPSLAARYVARGDLVVSRGKGEVGPYQGDESYRKKTAPLLVLGPAEVRLSVSQDT